MRTPTDANLIVLVPEPGEGWEGVVLIHLFTEPRKDGSRWFVEHRPPRRTRQAIARTALVRA
jgi:hypothetical protein